MNSTTKLSLYSLVIVTPLFFASCGEKKSEENNQSNQTESSVSVKPYPLKVCIVSGKNLGSMGEPYVFVHNGQEIKMCCDHCLPKFNKNPDKYLAQLKSGSAVQDDADHSGHNH